MPKLFAYAEQEGIAEHTGMTRVQLIVSVVRRQIERGNAVKVQEPWKCCPMDMVFFVVQHITI